MDSGELAARLARIRELLASGATLAQTGADRGVRLSKSEVHRLAQRHSLPRHRTWLPRKERVQIDRLLRAGLDRQTIAALVQVNYNAVYKRSLKMQDVPRRIRGSIRCACGARVNVVPCIACQARAALGNT